MMADTDRPTIDERIHRARAAADPVNALLALLTETRNYALHLEAAAALCSVGRAHSERLIAILREDDHPRRRALAAWALGALPDDTAPSGLDARGVDPLLAALADPDQTVRLEAVTGLGLLGDRRAVAPLCALLAEEDSRLVRLETVRALRKLGDPRAIPALAARLDDAHATVREETAAALAALRPAESNLSEHKKD